MDAGSCCFHALQGGQRLRVPVAYCSISDPPGCLQFSLLLRVPLSALPAQKIVFVQYLFALAVAEACRSEQVLGSEGSRVRIKWPNDIYAIARDGEKKKIGGILVNTSFGSGKVELVIGASSSRRSLLPV